MPYLLDKTPVEFRNRPLLFIDLEMTGLDVSRHEIVEIAALLVPQPDFTIANSYYAQMPPDCLLAGWAVQNEWDFLNAAIAREGLPYFYHHHLIEVSTLAFVKLYPDSDVKFLNLNRVSKKLGIYLDHHKPDSDIRATYAIFKKLSGF